jgi:hypothetical protein
MRHALNGGTHPETPLLADSGGRLNRIFPSWGCGLGGLSAVRDEQAGTLVPSTHFGATDGVLDPGLLPGLVAVAVTGQRSPNGKTNPGVGGDDDVMGGGVPRVFRLLSDSVLTGGCQKAVHDQYGEPCAGCSASDGPR